MVWPRIRVLTDKSERRDSHSFAIQKQLTFVFPSFDALEIKY
jgi:hypothetical protein